jgi:hypothetical protein
VWNGSTPLLFASMHNYMNICKYLLSVGADIRIKNNNNKDALANYLDDSINLVRDINIQSYGRSQLEEWWKDGPHPSQILRRKEETWQPRKAIMMFLAETGFRPTKNTKNNIDLEKTSRNDVLGNNDLSRMIVTFV